MRPHATLRRFIRNFWEGFREVLGAGHVIKSLEKCDFTPIYDWHAAERDKKKNMTKEVCGGRWGSGWVSRGRQAGGSRKVD